MSKSLQGRCTTSNANTWVANSYWILYDKENRCVLSRFLNFCVVGAVLVESVNCKVVMVTACCCQATGARSSQRQKVEVDQMSSVQSSDSSPSGSVSPRPPATQSQPRVPGPRPPVAGYWSYDARAAPPWGPLVGAPMRYMMDPRSYVWHMSQGGNETFIPHGIAVTYTPYVYFKYFYSEFITDGIAII